MRKPDSCPHCGRPFPPAFSVTGPVRQRIVDIVSSRPAGITRDELFSAVYADDPNGGPLTMNVISVIINDANKQLRPQGYEITASHRGRGALYRLERLRDADPKRQ